MPFFRSSRNGRSENTSEYLQTRRFKEKNILSAILGTATIVVLCASLVEPVWFHLQGGRCCQSYLGANEFFSISKEELERTVKNDDDCKKLQEEDLKAYGNCITSHTLALIHVIIIFTTFAISTSIFSFVLDVVAPRKKPVWKFFKRYAFGYVFTVIFSATTVGFCYWVSEEIYDLQFHEKKYPGSKVEVSFSTGVYLVTAAGGIAILATASNLMRQYPTEEEEQAEMLMEEESDEEGDAQWSNLTGPEPPAYAP